MSEARYSLDSVHKSSAGLLILFLPLLINFLLKISFCDTQRPKSFKGEFFQVCRGLVQKGLFGTQSLINDRICSFAEEF